MKRRVFVRAMALGLAAACAREPDRDAVGTLERERLELIAQAAEPIAQIAVREGESVRAGQLLLQLETARVDARVAQAAASRDRARAQLEELERGPRSERIERARAELTAARSAARTGVRELERVKALAARDFASRAREDALRNELEQANARQVRAQAELEELTRGATAEELAQARAALAAAQAALSEVEIERSRYRVEAPTDGAVDALPFELGERPAAGAVVVVLLASSAPYARVYVPEPLRVRLGPGSSAQIHVDGRPQPFAGRVRSIAQDASFTPYYSLTRHDRSRLSYLAEIELVEGGAELPTGVPVEVQFPAESVAADVR